MCTFCCRYPVSPRSSFLGRPVGSATKRLLGFATRSGRRFLANGCAKKSKKRGGSASAFTDWTTSWPRSEEHTSELQSRLHLVCRLLLEKKKTHDLTTTLARIV